ncbi:lipopolysaccharide biosynthesis protein [Vibrio aestuarianus]|uniref:lipopolysaccharide biosynthesis protein n=1 Tax=Vibrio aestuarianus TaxID=28171 RepID=UPI001559CCE1|nr:oligosaccharide flippase family protein [Vibrio aestuarianus]MDE1234347.1 oligosaccharide flippase family protein [Vibrio aestuarianus]MDE1245207.1 oligosaccharide flippase family protein [Vibrio aestuarianus]NGZ64416.1 oligosaccharide flippase family protein [Vibrio aestuarianus subsp. cardii]NGZ66715.1 oligosaccharide flippase family protein [Vibrio aestuarianus subsp. cardii]
MKNVNRDFMALLFGRLLQIVITLFTLRVSTTILPEEELGTVYFVVAIQAFFVLSFISPIGQYFTRQTNCWFVGGVLRKNLFKYSLYLLLIAVVAFLLLSLTRLLGITDLSFDLILIISCLIFSQSANQTIVPLFNMIEHRYAFVTFNLMTALLSAIFSFLLLIYWSETSISWLLGIVLGNMTVTGISVWWMKNNIHQNNNAREPKNNNVSEVVSFALPIAFSTFFMWFLASGYRVLIEHAYGLAFLATLGVGLAVSCQIFSIVESLLMQYFVPALYRNIGGVCKDTRLKFINQYISTVIPIYFSLAIFLTFAIEYIFPFLVAEKYYTSYMIAVYGVWVELFRVLTNAFAITGQIEKVTSRTVLPYIIGSTVLASTLSLNYYLKLEINVMFLLIASNALVLIYMVVKMNSLQRVSLPIKNISILGVSAIPAVFFLIWGNITQEASINSLLLLCIGVVIYFLGFVFSFGKLKND